jgi:Lhr-like helicase
MERAGRAASTASSRISRDHDSGGNALIAAPTGSGRTLAAFLSAINDLVVEGIAHGLSYEVHVLNVSPLKALSSDIQIGSQQKIDGLAPLVDCAVEVDPLYPHRDVRL